MGFCLDLLGILITLLTIGILYIKWKLTYWQRRNIPYIEPSFPFGNVENPLNKTKPLGEEITELYYIGRSRGYKYCGIYNLINANFLPLDLDLLKNIMAKDFDYFVDRGLYYNEKDEPISANVFTIGGHKWKNLRSKLTQPFSTGRMKYMFPNIVKCGVDLENHMREIDCSKPIEIVTILGMYTMNVIGSCGFGVDCNTFKDPDSPFKHFGQRVFARNRFSHLKSIFSFNFPNLARFMGLISYSSDVTEFITELVQITIDYREKNNITRNDFLQLFIDFRKGDSKGMSLTSSELIAQSFLFFVGGFESSSTTMTYALYELATHSEIQERARNEIIRILKKHDNNMIYEACSEMKYLKQIIDETLRKYPILFSVTRVCVKDYKIPGTNDIIEKGTMVSIPTRGIHYDTEYYENPEEFDPERFNDENRQKQPPYSYIPFGEGPRNCIGLRFGIIQITVGLTYVLKNFRLRLSDRTQTPLKFIPSSLIQKPVGGIWLQLEKLNHSN